MSTSAPEEFDRDLVVAWVAALRSGEYKQCRGQLEKSPHETKEGYTAQCCLGVLCRVAGVEFDGGLGEPEEDIIRRANLRKDYHDAITGHNLISTLINMNDEERRGFNAIADKIEEVLLSESSSC